MSAKKAASAGAYAIHDLRRTCITNWAQRLPIHVVQQLAGHGDIKTTQQFYLSVQPAVLSAAKAVQGTMLRNIPKVDPTDPKLAQSGKKRVFPGRKMFEGKL